ncbi:MAG TPA: oligoendopeptidase F [bacterium]|nr:oligoendopeptidase F [bacterium]
MNKDNQEITRDQIPDKYKWNLTDLFIDDDEWQKTKNDLEAQFSGFEKFKNNLANSADNLYNCLSLYFQLKKTLFRLYAYAYQSSDQDIRQPKYISKRQEIDQLIVKFDTIASFIDSEIIGIDEKTLSIFLENNKALQEYARYINNILRLKSNILSVNEEKIISQAGFISNTALEIYEVFKEADMPRPIITLDNNQVIRLDDANFTLYRSSLDQATRQKVFSEFFNIYKQYENSFGVQLYNQIKSNIFYKNVRHYNSCLESALSANNIPVDVYKNLINSVHKNLPVLQRYLNLRKRILGLDKLHYYDLYVPLVKEIDLNYSYEQAQELIIKSLKPLGDDYLKVVDKVFNNRWIDVYPNMGKRSGAYSSGQVYDVHPFILLNYMGKFNDVSTLTHELGHTIHSYYSNTNQNYVDSNYPIFLAEVASTCHEFLLIEKILKDSTDQKQRLAILGRQLELFRTTLFRQTQFAEFELKINELAEQGKSLTGEELSKIYLDILKTYYEADKENIVIDDLYSIEWAQVPHFYYNFYVFQYATSLCASTIISKQILENEDMGSKYINDFLSAGCSNYPIDILKKLGLDMTNSSSYDLAFKKMTDIMDEMEDILATKIN